MIAHATPNNSDNRGTMLKISISSLPTAMALRFIEWCQEMMRRTIQGGWIFEFLLRIQDYMIDGYLFQSNILLKCFSLLNYQYST